MPGLLLRAIAHSAAVTRQQCVRALVSAVPRPPLALPGPSASSQAISSFISASTTMAAAAQPQQQRLGAGAPEQQKKFTVAIEGCCHGELDNIYATLEYMQKAKGTKIDLLICCGDFQAVRNLDDMETMSIPLKYRQIMTFWKYYSGEKVAPIPTIFIGGNHEASNYLRELFYGGWAAPNIYFLGFAGCVQFGGHRIAGLSGTYVSPHYTWGHHERLPYDERAVKSVYHVRELEVHRLMQLHGDISLFLSHDWPNEITRYGDKARLFKKKPYFQQEAERGELGSPPNQQLLEALQPGYWFAAHLHCKFAAVVPHNQRQQQQQHQQGGNLQQQQPGQQFSLPGMPAALAAPAAAAAAGESGGGSSSGSEPKVTRFLALDKCLPNRDFLQLIELDVKGPLELSYDPQWLAVLRSTHSLYSASKHGPRLPAHWGGRKGPSPEDVAFVDSALQQCGGAAVPLNFVQTAPAYDPQSRAKRGNMPREDLRNPQTLALLEMLGLSYNLDTVVADSTTASNYINRQWGGPVGGGGTHYQPQTSLLSQQQQQRNPEEIDLDSDEDDEQPATAAAAGGSAAAAAGRDEDADEEEPGGPPGGALADGAPDSEDEGGQGGGAAAAAAGAPEEGSAQQQQQQLDDPMFGEVNTAQFPYYNKD